jgi:hypothetical protein
VAARELHIARLRQVFAGKGGPAGFVLWGVCAQSSADPYKEPERWVAEALDSLTAEAEKLRDRQVFRPLCLEFGPYGVHFVDRMLGARVFFHEGQWWADNLRRPVGALEPPDLERDDTWRLARRIAEAFLGAKVSVPIFGLPTIASALNVAVNLYGEEFLMAMLERPDAARHDLALINDLLARLHRWYLTHIPLDQLQPVVAAAWCQPPGYGQLCGCTTHLLSGSQYADLVAPLDEALLAVYPHGGMIHLCGRHTQHIRVWQAMKSLRAVQINDRAAKDLEIYFRELRDDQIFYLSPTKMMTIERAMQITGGRRLVIVADIPCGGTQSPISPA